MKSKFIFNVKNNIIVEVKVYHKNKYVNISSQRILLRNNSKYHCWDIYNNLTYYLRRQKLFNNNITREYTLEDYKILCNKLKDEYKYKDIKRSLEQKEIINKQQERKQRFLNMFKKGNKKYAKKNKE